MDSQTKTGKVFLQPRKPGKKWKPVWLSLVPPSSSGVGRLEIQDAGGTLGDGMRRHQALVERKPKVIRLSELLNVLRLPPNAEACPMENMCAFCVATQDRTLVFAALKDDCVEWVDKLCQSTFQKNAVPESKKAQMEENAIYASADVVSDFRVVVQKTDAATRCGLQGAHWLQVGREALLVKDNQKSLVREWPYELLRRYGKDKTTLSIETGRRCDCGPGTIIFETSQAEMIFSLIQATIRRKTTHTAPPGLHGLELDKSSVPNFQALSPLPRTPDISAGMAAILENKLRTHDAGEDSAASHPAPITLMPLPSLPTQDARPRSRIDNVYADPIDCVKSPEVGTALYVDPASVLPLKPPGNAEPSLNKQSSVYAEVFDKLSTVPKKTSPPQLAGEDHIYSEPVKEATKASPKTERKDDPFAHLYAQVNKSPRRSPSPSPRRSPSPHPNPEPKQTEQSQNDVIYENLGVI